MKKILMAVVGVGLLVLMGYVAFPKQILRVYAPPWIFKKFPLEEVAARFEAKHPEVEVELTRASEWSAPTYITAWKNGETPFDLYIGGSGSMLAPAIVGDWLEPLDSLLTDFMAPDKFVGGILAAGRYKAPNGNGYYYPVLPFMGEVAIIGVNTELLQKAGLWDSATNRPVPIPGWDPVEFFAWFEKLKTAAPLGAHLQIWNREFMQYNYCGPILAMAGTFMDKNGKGFDVTSGAAYKWLTFIQRMNREGIGKWALTDAAGYAKWKTGTVGSFYAAQGHIMELVSVTGDEGDIAYLGWPGAEKNGSIIWTHSVWIPRVTKQKDLAKTFIREVVFSRYFQQWSFNHYGKLPALKDYYGEGITWFKNEIPTILAIANASKPIPVFKDLQKYLDILSKYLPDAAFGRITVDQALIGIEQDSRDLDFTDIRAP
ncbi:MAG TPA: extracellular solute-binding protein [Desulfobacteraceae bacterium]|nr:extracellular solute-binding protein [Desulfobacteraceae bacterium]